MKQTQLFIMCLLAIAAVFLNAACSSKNNERQGDKGVVIQRIETERKPSQTKSQTEGKPKFFSSHQVGSTVR